MLQSDSRPQVPWAPLSVGLLKLNFDGSCRCEAGLAGYGGVNRNDSGSTMLSFTGRFPNGFVIEVELFALWRGILEFESLGVIGNIVEGDSKVVAGWACGSQCPWIFLDKIEQIRHIISIHNFQIAWSRWSANFAGDDMARQEVSLLMEIVNRFL